MIKEFLAIGATFLALGCDGDYSNMPNMFDDAEEKSYAVEAEKEVQTIKADDKSPVEVELCELLGNPEAYRGKRVTTSIFARSYSICNESDNKPYFSVVGVDENAITLLCTTRSGFDPHGNIKRSQTEAAALLEKEMSDADGEQIRVTGMLEKTEYEGCLDKLKLESIEIEGYQIDF